MYNNTDNDRIKYYLLFRFCVAGHSSYTMVQMGAKTTTITESDMLQQETYLLKDDQKELETTNYDEEESKFPVSKQEIIWTNVVFITLLHVLSVYCFCNYFFSTKWQTYVWSEYDLRLNKNVHVARMM